MATINIHRNEMASKLFLILSWVNPVGDDNTVKNKNEVFLVATEKQDMNWVDMSFTALELDEYTITPLEVVGDTENAWLKRIKTFGIERLLDVKVTSDNNVYSTKIINPLKIRTEVYDTVPITYNPILIYQPPSEKIDTLVFAKYREVRITNEVTTYLYNVIMELQITPLGTQDSTYGNLYHLKHLTFTFS